MEESPIKTKASVEAEESSPETWTTEVRAELLSCLALVRCLVVYERSSFHRWDRCNSCVRHPLCMTIRRALCEDTSSHKRNAHRQAKSEGNDKFSQFQHRVSSTFCVQVPSSSRVNLQNALRKAHAPGACTYSSQAHERPNFLSRA